jgi:hypothetical protein
LKRLFWFLQIVALFLLSSCSSKPVPQPAQAQEDASNEVNFSLSNVNQVAPDAILQEVAFFGTGRVFTCANVKTPTVTLVYPESPEPYKMTTVVACGWHDHEEISIEIKDPTGNVSTESQVSSKQFDDGPAGIVYGFVPTMPGKYKITFIGQAEKASITIPVITPDGARMYSYHKTRLVFYYLQPNEKFTIYVYQRGENADLFVGWQNYQANQNGFLFVNIPDDYRLSYYAMGENSGYLTDKNVQYKKIYR